MLSHRCVTPPHTGPLPPRPPSENLELLRAGCCNLARHIANARTFGVPVVVAINRFATDTDAELGVVQAEALAAGARQRWCDGRRALRVGRWVTGRCGGGCLWWWWWLHPLCSDRANFRHPTLRACSLRRRCGSGCAPCATPVSAFQPSLCAPAPQAPTPQRLRSTTSRAAPARSTSPMQSLRPARSPQRSSFCTRWKRPSR